MDPRQFLEVARELAVDDSAAHNRTALSRGYYAVYNVACDMFSALGFDIERGYAGHEAIQSRLRQSGVDPLIHVGAQLYRLQAVRVRADYWMHDPFPERRATVARWLARAEQMIGALDTVMAQPAVRERVRRAVQTWEQSRTGRSR